jgi:tRNA (guanine37-N1)-methyltransferase
MGKAVPEVLVGGDHAKVAKWRAEQALERTRIRRPDLLPPEPKKPDPDARAPFDDPSPGA